MTHTPPCWPSLAAVIRDVNRLQSGAKTEWVGGYDAAYVKREAIRLLGEIDRLVLSQAENRRQAFAKALVKALR